MQGDRPNTTLRILKKRALSSSLGWLFGRLASWKHAILQVCLYGLYVTTSGPQRHEMATYGWLAPGNCSDASTLFMVTMPESTLSRESKQQHCCPTTCRKIVLLALDEYILGEEK